VRWFPRKRLLIDWRSQGALLFRAFIYWALFAITITQLILFWEILNGPDGPFWSHFRFLLVWDNHTVVLVAWLVLLPVLLIDVAYISNRIVGPLTRVRETLRGLAAGKTVSPLKFRKNDYFQAMADELNAVSARIALLEQQLGGAPGKHTEPDEEPAWSR
jgi:hypothetical protein